MEERIVPVERGWYVKLAEYLEAGESFSEEGQYLSRVLFTKEGKKLIFKAGRKGLPTEVKALQMAGYAFDNKARCSGCGKEVEWWVTARKKKMPFTVVEVREMPGDRNSTIVRHDRIPHFAMCAAGEKFRRKK
jgi:hypothetical protein